MSRNDLDMLELGNGEFDADSSPLSAAHARSHYSMWAAMKAVLLLGCDLTKVRRVRSRGCWARDVGNGQIAAR